MTIIPFKTAHASNADGTIDPVSRFAWGENIGWLDFGTTAGNVHVTDTELTGYAWSENAGWISLNCSNTSSCAANDFKVGNDVDGNLSGYAWSENAGWIDLNPSGGGVTIDGNGEFSGYAWGENIGWIDLNCATDNSCSSVDYKVATDWRPLGARPMPHGGAPNAGLMDQNALAFTINNNANSTDLPEVTVDLSGGPNTAAVVISEDPNFFTEKHIPYDATSARNHASFTLTGSPGVKTLYAKFCTSWNLCSGAFSASIVLNPPPAVAPVPPSPAPAASPYDINSDGRVDIYEFNQMLVAWGPQTSPDPSDYDHDGVVDIYDFNLLMTNWTL